ncbi:hypothetical protein D7V80_12215 [Corallococcus sp. CA054B]|uniref:hypothetical protein n=1 Tax=Corallococcus sp. CA054B TaxID=2316734 RepID=UPI000EA2C9E2|nr:hypothetical protein [Corallococcus sp. CA054B]RKG68512.1 hypothetical protein D7V80_12215 [Corallococcus sp. CA054B]
MPVQLEDQTRTVTLDPESLLEWLRTASTEVPKHVNGQRLSDFLKRRDKTYGDCQQDVFLADFARFHRTCRSIEDAIENLKAYGLRVSQLQIDDKLAYDVLKVGKGYALSKDVLGFTLKTLRDMQATELQYAEEAIASLCEQMDWHLTGPVDKGEVSKDVRKTVKANTATGKGTSAQLKDLAKLAYYEPIRNRLMNHGFIVSPRGTALGAVFPEKDWVDGTGVPFFDTTAKQTTDALMKKYELLGDTPEALTRLLMPRKKRMEGEDPLASAVGCICVSWTRHERNGKTLYIPVLGLSGVTEQKPNLGFFEKTCRHLGLPTSLSLEPYAQRFEFTAHEDVGPASRAVRDKVTEMSELEKTGVKKDSEAYLALKKEKEVLDKRKKELMEADGIRRVAEQTQFDIEKVLVTNYETMLQRTNLCAIQYRARELLRLRKPSRQALMSYVSFRESKDSKHLEAALLQPRTTPGVDLWICFWHSFNCAEPAALICASSYFGDGCDVEVCFPYEGLSDAGPFSNRPKETCPWCATVELGFRSVTKNTGGVDGSLSSGSWLTELTLNTGSEPKKKLSLRGGFDAFDDNNAIMQSTSHTLGGSQQGGGLVRNKDLDEEAYGAVVKTKIGRVRSMYYLLGLMDPKVVALDRPLFPWQTPARFKFKGLKD